MIPVSYLRRLLSTPSLLDTGLPYNWNWQRPWSEVTGFLEHHPIVLMDVGARGVAPPELDSLGSSVRRVGFEPDPQECRRLNDEGQGTFFPKLLAGSTGRQTLRLYRDPAYTRASSWKPSPWTGSSLSTPSSHPTC
ncbi:MAG: hypothetical protein LC799_07870 [Actinobacteria bacterium]|nr:hypothetical protein [Actinomycetota bacterium]